MNTKTEDSEIDRVLRNLDIAIKNLQRVTALMKLTNQESPYRALLRLMCRLELVHGWPT